MVQFFALFETVTASDWQGAVLVLSRSRIHVSFLV